MRIGNGDSLFWYHPWSPWTFVASTLQAVGAAIGRSDSFNSDHTVLNVDGSCLGNPGLAGFGGVIRHAHGA